MLQVRDRLGPKLGFRGSLNLISQQEIIGILSSFRWGSISILDRSVNVHLRAWGLIGGRHRTIAGTLLNVISHHTRDGYDGG